MSLNYCRECKNWDGCPGARWFSIGEIRYCRLQSIWLIQEFLKVEGIRIVMDRYTWPDGDTAEAPKTSHASNAHAPYEKVVQVVGELSRRLERTGKDGRLLVLEVKQEGGLSNDARNALNYACGDKYKNMEYFDWMRQRRYRNNLTVTTKT